MVSKSQCCDVRYVGLSTAQMGAMCKQHQIMHDAAEHDHLKAMMLLIRITVVMRVASDLRTASIAAEPQRCAKNPPPHTPSGTADIRPKKDGVAHNGRRPTQGADRRNVTTPTSHIITIWPVKQEAVCPGMLAPNTTPVGAAIGKVQAGPGPDYQPSSMSRPGDTPPGVRRAEEPQAL